MRTYLERPELALSNPLLAACAAATRSALLECGKLQTFDAKTVLFGDGDAAGVALFPLEGTLQMSKTTQRGRRQIMCHPSAEQCGGVCLLAFGDRALADISGLNAGSVLVVPRAAFQQLTHQDPVLCQAAWHSATSCMSHLSLLVAQLSFTKVAERVASALLDGARADGGVMRLTQADLAAEVGSTREVVARYLALLQAEGTIRLGRGRITVLDREKLRSIA